MPWHWIWTSNELVVRCSRDVVALIHATLNYLQYLHDYFHEILAVTAYNGE